MFPIVFARQDIVCNDPHCINLQTGSTDIPEACAQVNAPAGSSGDITSPVPLIVRSDWNAGPVWDSSFLKRTIAHELSHLLGLKENQCTQVNSIMGTFQQCGQVMSNTGLTLSPNLPVLDVDNLRNTADLIVEATVTGARAHLSSNERVVQTTFTLAVHRVIRDQRSAQDVATDLHTVEVTQVGGTLHINGRTVIQSDSSGRPLAPGDRVVLLLKKVQAQDTSYGIHGGPYGAYQVREGKVFSYIAENMTRRVRFEGARVDELIAAIQ